MNTADSDVYIVEIEEAERHFLDDVFYDDVDVFLNMNEFARPHNIDGVELRAAVRKLNEPMSHNVTDKHAGLHVVRLNVQFRTRDLTNKRGRLPIEGERILFDGRHYEVEWLEDEFGITSVTLSSYRGRLAERGLIAQ